MSKPDRKKKRNKRKAPERARDYQMPELAPTSPTRGRRGPLRGSVAVDDPQKVALAARARHRGSDDTPESRDRMKAVYLGCDEGRCLDHQGKSDLWQTYVAFCAAQLRYDKRILGMTSFPAGMKLEMASEPIETDKSHSVDLRSAEEKNEDTKRAKAVWDERLCTLPLHYRSVIWQARAGHAVLWADGAPTGTGLTFVSALEMLQKAVDQTQNTK